MIGWTITPVSGCSPVLIQRPLRRKPRPVIARRSAKDLIARWRTWKPISADQIERRCIRPKNRGLGRCRLRTDNASARPDFPALLRAEFHILPHAPPSLGDAAPIRDGPTAALARPLGADRLDDLTLSQPRSFAVTGRDETRVVDRADFQTRRACSHAPSLVATKIGHEFGMKVGVVVCAAPRIVKLAASGRAEPAAIVTLRSPIQIFAVA
jgi:hypothetical protein